MRRCPLCRGGITEHALDLTPSGANVRCLRDETTRPVSGWLGVPAHPSSGGTFLAVLLWVGIPLATVGIGSWLMPAIAGGMYRRRTWIIAAVLLAALVVLSIAVSGSDPDEVTTLSANLLITAWLGGSVFGAFQVRPWLAARRQRDHH